MRRGSPQDVEKLTVGSGVDSRHMLRLLALLVVCMVSFFMQGESAAAHLNRLVPLQSMPQCEAVADVVLTEASFVGDCSTQLACCTMVCASCKLPIPEHRTELLWRPDKASKILAFHDDCLRSITLGGDPPVPRTRSL